MPFIIDYSRWVLKSRPEYGLKVSFIIKKPVHFARVVFEYTRILSFLVSEIVLTGTFSSQIFTEDIPEVEGLPRDQVLSHIEQNAPELQIPYLVR